MSKSAFDVTCFKSISQQANRDDWGARIVLKVYKTDNTSKALSCRGRVTGDWACHPTSIIVNSKVVPYHLIKSLQLIWRLGTCRWNLRILHPQVSPSDLTRIYRICICSSDEPFMHSREGYFGVYFPSCAATREISTKITLE